MRITDAHIAGTCISRGCTLATRSVKDFATVDGPQTVNPFAHETKGAS